MKNIQPLLTILSFCLLLSCNSGNDDTDSVVEEMEQQEIEEMDMDDNNNSNSGLVRSIDDGFEITYEYDGDRLITASGNDSNRDLMISYTYNSNGTIMNKGIFEFEEPGSSLDIQFSYIYDTDSRLIEFGHNQGEYATVTYQGDQIIADFGSSVQVIIELNQEGRVARLEAGSFYKIFTYDTQGNLIFNEEFDSDTDELTKTYQYTYDSNPNPFFNQLESTYLSDFVFTFWGSGWSFSDSLYYDFPHLPNNLTSITFTDQQSTTSTFTYTYNSEGQIITAEGITPSDPSEEGMRNYTITYYE